MVETGLDRPGAGTLGAEAAMLRIMLIAMLGAGCWCLPQAAAIAEDSEVQPEAQPHELIVRPAEPERFNTEQGNTEPGNPEQGSSQEAPSDSVSRGYYANYPAKGYYAPYVYPPNFPPRYPKLLGYGFGIRGHMLYHPRYIFGHPAGYLREHCPNDQKYGPVYYQSGMPVAGSRVEWLHTGAGVGRFQRSTVEVSPEQQAKTNPANRAP
jgi:hypothetical protein